ncbi:unnamed protein product [Angiostrongylus costaricensis]|uniref:Uncharacterized protein n=1 Tax=Angiostrongylus costaricensis TaxID=334426 RepID=A0A158PLV5_ANGCS|nr:unnamed protein product [Angiostrongylus costaricensis]
MTSENRGRCIFIKFPTNWLICDIKITDVVSCKVTSAPLKTNTVNTRTIEVQHTQLFIEKT